MTKALLHELGKSISFGRLSLKGKVLWPMLLASCDEQGRGIAEPDVIKWQVCPNVNEIDIEDVPSLLAEMQQQEMVYLYTDNRKRQLYQVVRWWEYRQHAWAHPSRYDAPEGWIDRVRYQAQGGDHIKENWDHPGGFVDIEADTEDELPSELPSDLPSPEEGPQLNLTKPNSTKPNSTKQNNAGKPAVGDDSRSPPGMTEGLREMLRLFGAKRFATVAQKEALHALEQEHGTDVFLEGVAWAAKQGMNMGKAVVALETALPKWGKNASKDGVIRVGR
jgi:hypothetical protein